MPATKSNYSNNSRASSISLLETESDSLSASTKKRYFTRSCGKLEGDELQPKFSTPVRCLYKFSGHLRSENSQLLLGSNFDDKNYCNDLVKYCQGPNNSDEDIVSYTTSKEENFVTFFKCVAFIIAIGLCGVFYTYMTQELDNVFENMKESMENIRQLEHKLNELVVNYAQLVPQPKCGTSEEINWKNAIKEVLSQYDADKTGRADYAMESAGGKIVALGKTESYPYDTLTVLGITFRSTVNEPKLMITPGNNPGECWAFKGSKGSAVIELISQVYITGVTLEHITKNISPTGDINTAPKEFSIWGLTNAGDKEFEQLLGIFTYQEDKTPLQYFSIEKGNQPYKRIVFKVHSNHGNEEFTCVYRLRVHGELYTQPAKLYLI